MKLTLFSRLMMGYLVILILVMGVSGYAILQLRQFNTITRYIMSVDVRIIDYVKKLSDSILSQLRYERKYIITKDKTLYNQFLSKKGEFDRYLTEVCAIADTTPKRKVLGRIRESHERYQSLVNQEVEYIKKNQHYQKKSFSQEKWKIGDGILKELEILDSYSQQDTYSRMKLLDEAGASARNMAIVIAALALVLLITITFFITRSITQPISIMKNKTREIAKGNFEGILNLTSPPEIRELAGAFNLMCNKLKDLDKMKSDFFSSMSHELRTPLASIKEGISLLQEGVGGAISEKQKRLLIILSEEINRLIGLVNSLLDFSKMEAGMMTYRFEPGSLAPLIERVMIEIAPLVETKKINLATKMGDGLPLIKMDSERILQALRNLIGNAVKFTPEGGQIRVSAHMMNGGVEVSITDTGPGITPENLDTIFDKFQQGTPSGLYQIKGTGLGLAIVKHIITSHGGKIWAESKPGQGSTFIFILPA